VSWTPPDTLPYVVHAPGKLVLVGEYAVLDGAGAVVAAVPWGVRCQVVEGRGWTTPGDDRFVRAALDGAPGAYGPTTRRFVFDAWPPLDLPSKPGFGGSAAACVAACLACGRPPSDAYAVHRAVQGDGSGIDVFASIHGGVRVFDPADPTRHGTCVEVHPVAVWSGRSAATAPRVAAYRQWAATDPQAHARFVAASAACVQAFPAAPTRMLGEAGALVRAMAADAGLHDYETDSLRAIRSVAEDHDGACKPSGAGGGDVAVALFDDEKTRLAFLAACARRGWAAFDARPAPGAAPLPLIGAGCR
jgi:phosphomevalonate kinase